ncbi:uncharacterized protein ACOB8E_009559 isoform 1-T1 [Sarcophilus harrisii]
MLEGKDGGEKQLEVSGNTSRPGRLPRLPTIGTLLGPASGLPKIDPQPEQRNNIRPRFRRNREVEGGSPKSPSLRRQSVSRFLCDLPSSQPTAFRTQFAGSPPSCPSPSNY